MSINVEAMAQVVVDTASGMKTGAVEYPYYEGVVDAYASLVGVEDRTAALDHATRVVESRAEAVYLLGWEAADGEHLVRVWADGTGEYAYRFSPANRWSVPAKMESAR